MSKIRIQAVCDTFSIDEIINESRAVKRLRDIRAFKQRRLRWVLVFDKFRFKTRAYYKEEDKDKSILKATITKLDGNI